MKSLSLIIPSVFLFSLAACSGNSDKTAPKQDQAISPPVLNSGPETEMDRAKEATDTSKQTPGLAGADSGNVKAKTGDEALKNKNSKPK